MAEPKDQPDPRPFQGEGAAQAPSEGLKSSVPPTEVQASSFSTEPSAQEAPAEPTIPSSPATRSRLESEVVTSLLKPRVQAPAAPLVEAETPPASIRAVYEHPWAVRFCHWLNAASLFIMIATGLQIFNAFPSFGPKVPEKDIIDIPDALTLGGWLGGALQWHFTLMWVFVGTGIFYLSYQFLSGHYKTVLFTRKDIPGVWPMVNHYFLFGPKPRVTGQYNPLQKLAYTATVLFGVASVVTGIVIYKPTQFSWLAWLMGGFHYARIWHFAAMCGFLSFIPGHLLMVGLHGWNNFMSMLTGWKKDPEYL